MTKLCKQTFYNKTTQEMKVFSYNISIKKSVVEEANLQDSEVEVIAKDGKIIIQKVIDKQK